MRGLCPLLSPQVRPRVICILLTVLFLGCATTREATVRDELGSFEKRAAKQPPAASKTDAAGERSPGAGSEVKDSRPSARGSLSWYFARALEDNPEVQAAFERYSAQVHRIAEKRRLPNPTVTFGYFVQSVETRVGPQLARLGVKQALPWPSQLSASADAAASRAEAAARRFEAKALVVREEVASAYWRLWMIRETRKIHETHLTVLHDLSETTLARLATGQIDLADQQQIDLTSARLEDSILGMGQQERAAEARMRALTALPQQEPVLTEERPPPATLPMPSERELLAAVESHPLLDAYEAEARSQESLAKAERTKKLPDFSLAADWIITGESAQAGVPDSGKDAVIVGAGMSVPLWQGSYEQSARAARAEAAAARWERVALADRARSELQQALADVRDASRRVSLYEDALLPQAETAYASVLGSYTTGRGSAAQALLAQQALLELRVELEEIKANHAQAWARLEEVVGREVPRRSPSGEAQESER